MGCSERCGMYSRMRALPALSTPTIIMGGTTPSRIRRSPVSSTCHSIPVKDRIVQAGVFWIVVAGRQPHAQESRVTENAAVEFVQAQISRRGLRADYAGSGSGNMAFCLLDFFHPEKCTTRIQRRSQFRLSQF